jgi:RNA polymerase sigma-70 factor (ECF subfamily)
MTEKFETWFAREILVHEAALMRFISRAWLARNEVRDICHEIYVRVLEAAEQHRPSAPKSFLFATARNLLIDRARRHRIVSIDLLQDMDALNVLVDEVTPERAADSLQQLGRLAQCFEKLPARAREVVWLRKVEDMPQKRIAQRLNIAEGTVEAHLVRGVRLLAQLFYADGSDDKRSRHRRDARHEGTHRKDTHGK